MSGELSEMGEISPFLENKTEDQMKLEYDTLEGSWGEVVKMYEDSWTHTATINNSKDTALHLAVDNLQEKTVAELVKLIVSTEEKKKKPALEIQNAKEEEKTTKSALEIQNAKEEEKTKKPALEIQNARGDTPLHLAASKGSTNMCYWIVGKKNERAHLLRQRNNKGETPLFLAALHWEKEAFLYLHDCFSRFFDMTPDDHIRKERHTITLRALTRDDQDTILHCAIEREYFDVAVVIIHHHEELIYRVNKEGLTPLKMLASRPSAFKSSINLGWLNYLLYHCIPVEQVDADTATKLPPDFTSKFDVPDDTDEDHPKNYETCYQFIRTLLNITVLCGLFPKKQHDDKENPKTRQEGDRENKKRQQKNQKLFPKKQHDDKENPKTPQEGDGENGKRQQKNQKLESLPPNYKTFWEFLKFVFILAAGLSGLGLLRLKRMKEKHVWSAQVLDLLMKEPSYIGRGENKSAGLGESSELLPKLKKKNQGEGDKKANDEEEIDKDDSPLLIAARNVILEMVDKILDGIPNNQGEGDKKANDEEEIDKDDSPLLIAARNGILEMVDKILDGIPTVIQDTTSNYKRNVLLTAVEGRQPLVVKTLQKQELWSNLIQGVDSKKNTVLHLAARKSRYRASQIPGSFMQMIWDIKWYQYVEELAPPYIYLWTNVGGKNPLDIFTEEHEYLIKDSGEWLKDTSQSCSVVAVLIAGVAFATCNTIPGGNNEQTGKPNYEGQPAFDVFAIASLLALCFSVTALIMFLATLTSRKLARDFLRDLPFKLLLGLSSLFLAIASMLASFCAAHLFVVDRFKGILFPIYAATCLPVTYYAIAQFPLYVDLLRAIFTKVPRPID